MAKPQTPRQAKKSSRHELLEAFQQIIIPLAQSASLNPMTLDMPLHAALPIAISPREAPPLKVQDATRSPEPDISAHSMWHWPKEGLHAISNAHLFFVIEGVADIEIGVTEWVAKQRKLDLRHGRFMLRLPAGSLVLIPPYTPLCDGNAPHCIGPNGQVSTVGRSRILWLNTLPEGAMCHTCRTHNDTHLVEPRNFVLDSRLMPLTELMLDELQQNQSGFTEIARMHLVAMLLRIERAMRAGRMTPSGSDLPLVATVVLRPAQGQVAKAADSAVMERAIRFIEAHLAEPLTAPFIADQSYTSLSHLNRLFRAQSQTSVMKFVEQKRVRAGQSLLANTLLPVTAIAAHLGYKHLPQFSRNFKRISGLSPLQYRRQQHLENHQKDTIYKNRPESSTPSRNN